MNVTQTDVALIGAGPIGLELAVALKKAQVEYIHLDARQIGHTIAWFAPQTRFFSSNERIAIAGVPLQTPDQAKATREEYLAYLRSIVLMFDLNIRTYEPVISVERNGKEFVITTEPRSGKTQIRAKRVVFCTGGTERPRRLNIPGEDLPHVSHYFRDPHLYFRKRLLIVGGKNSAVEAALRCSHAGAHVSLSYRQEKLKTTSIKYWLLPEITGLMDSGKIPSYFGTVPTEITPSHVTLRTSTSPAKAFTETFDFVLLLIGYEADMALLKNAGVELRDECQVPAFDPRTMETNIPGIYVAGCAIGGTQDKFSVFLENCHVHVPRIVAALTGTTAPPEQAVEYSRPET